MPRSLPRLLALLSASLAAVGLGEVLLRAFVPAGGFHLWRPGLEARFEPRAALMPGVEGPARFRVCSLGFRADERPADVRLSILALGGSSTECLYLDQEEAWPARLQSDLGARLAVRVWVANAGKSGRTTRDHALQLRHLLAQGPSFERVLLLTGVNDLCAWLAADGAPEKGDGEDLARAFDRVPRDLAGGPWWKRTALWELARGMRARWLGAPIAQDPSGAIYETWRAHRRGALRWRTELPDARAPLADFRAALAELSETCARHGAVLTLVTQPALWSAASTPELEALLWMGGVGEFQRRAGCEYYTAAALARGLALYNAELEAFAAERGLARLDLARALDGDPRCFYDDVHFNEEGARAAASFLADGLCALERP